MEPMGSLLDVHGFVVPEGVNKQGEPIDPHTGASSPLSTPAAPRVLTRESRRGAALARHYGVYAAGNGRGAAKKGKPSARA